MPITAQAAGVKAGAIADFAGSAAPAGWLIADGSAISRTLYSALFSYCGTTHGAGDGTTTFNIPDCRGEFRRGLDNGRGVDTARTLGSFQDSDNKGHRHNATIDGVAGTGGTYQSQVGLTTYNSASGGYETYFMRGVGNSTEANASSTSTTGGTESRPRNKAFLTCIKF